MADIYKGELQDYKGNTLYNHSEADVIFCTDGETVQEKLAKTEEVLGDSTGKTGSLEVNDSQKLVTSDATYQLAQKMGGCKFEQEGEDFFIVGADSVRKKLGSGSSYLAIRCKGSTIYPFDEEYEVEDFTISNNTIICNKKGIVKANLSAHVDQSSNVTNGYIYKNGISVLSVNGNSADDKVETSTFEVNVNDVLTLKSTNVKITAGIRYIE